MSGTAIARIKLAGNVALTAVVPATRILLGVVPIGTPRPAIGITLVSGIPFKYMAKGSGKTLWSDRIQVTVHADKYQTQSEVLALVLAALPSAHGTVGSFTCDSISEDSQGPDFYDSELNIHSGSQDFIVRSIR